MGIGRGKKSAQHHAAHLALLDIYREYVELPPGAGPTDGQSGNVLDADGDYKMEESSGRNTNTQFVPTTQGLQGETSIRPDNWPLEGHSPLFWARE